MTEIIIRRRFLSFLAAPAIVHVANLMPIKALRDDYAFEWSPFFTAYLVGGIKSSNYAKLVRITRAVMLPCIYVQVYSAGFAVYPDAPPS